MALAVKTAEAAKAFTSVMLHSPVPSSLRRWRSFHSPRTSVLLFHRAHQRSYQRGRVDWSDEHSRQRRKMWGEAALLLHSRVALVAIAVVIASLAQILPIIRKAIQCHRLQKKEGTIVFPLSMILLLIPPLVPLPPHRLWSREAHNFPIPSILHQSVPPKFQILQGHRPFLQGIPSPLL
jgi:hypothetical protein